MKEIGPIALGTQWSRRRRTMRRLFARKGQKIL